MFDPQRVEGIPGILIIHSKSHPLSDNLLLALNDWTATMLGESIIHLHPIRIYITEESGAAFLRYNVNTGISEVCGTPNLGNSAVNDHRSHSVSWFEVITSTFSIAVGGVSIRFLVF